MTYMDIKNINKVPQPQRDTTKRLVASIATKAISKIKQRLANDGYIMRQYGGRA